MSTYNEAGMGSPWHASHTMLFVWPRSPHTQKHSSHIDNPPKKMQPQVSH